LTKDDCHEEQIVYRAFDQTWVIDFEITNNLGGKIGALGVDSHNQSWQK
jgi:hypothetical protein